MPGNSFGAAFRITTAGESHGPANLVIIDGVPAGLPLATEDLTPDLARRRPGQSALVSPRNEADQPEILSGVFEGLTTGSPIAILIRNEDARSKDYSKLASLYRPGHADHSYEARFGHRDPRGGGRASARETVARVAAGAVARKLLAELCGTEILGYVHSVGPIQAPEIAPETLNRGAIEESPTRCPDPPTATEMQALIEELRDLGDSIGGTARVVARPLPAGLGEPVFDKLRADLGKALFSLPAVVGVEFGAGFAAARMRGSEHNDAFIHDGTSVGTRTNRHGGILGGISSGMPLILTCAVKPTSSIRIAQQTIDRAGEPTEVTVQGRHDPCLLPRFVPMAEAMVAIVLADHLLRLRLSRLNP